ncbi:MAG: hypothetical protein KDG52_20080 [Rhodocyclaceae bacterium]|nr:hypothetical protein [Rhodocyclaceae bacterium]
MAKDPVTPFRAPHKTKEARLAKMRERFEQAHPLPADDKRYPASPKALLVAIVIGVLMIWLVSALAT